MAKCAFLGLGVMGFPMAGHLRAAGHEVCVWNRTHARSDTWEAEHGKGATATVVEAVSGADYVMICVGADADVLAVVDAALPALAGGTVVIDHTTASPSCAREAAKRLAAKGVAFIDAPISGGQSGAEAGTLSVMCGGDPDDFARAELVMSAYGKTITHLGPVGAGQTAKCVNQICIAGTLRGLSEGLLFAEAAGLDAETLLQAIGGGAAQSWQMDNRLLTMAAREFDFGFALDWMIKDLGIAANEAEAMSVDVPLTQSVLDDYRALSGDGRGRLDTSALILAHPTAKLPKASSYPASDLTYPAK